MSNKHNWKLKITLIDNSVDRAKIIRRGSSLVELDKLLKSPVEQLLDIRVIKI